MAHARVPTGMIGSFLWLASALVAGGVVVLAADQATRGAAQSVRTATGEAQYIGFQPFEGQTCPIGEVDYARYPLMAYARSPMPAAQVAPDRGPEHLVDGMNNADSGVPNMIDRAPLRYIKDPWPAWSAIAVNPENNMVVVTDENLHRIVEYHRLDNTPPGVDAHEPQRVIGGVNTHSEMMCGVYIDPDTLDVYVTQNDTVNWLPVFGREARGNVDPDRKLATPHQAFGIAADEVRDELYITIQGAAAVVVYEKTAEGDSAPLRILEGDATELADPHGIYIDTVNDLVVVVNHGSRGFYGGTGEAVSRMEGTWQDWIASNGFPVQTGLRLLPRRKDNSLGGRFDLPSINIYAIGASGNTPPLRRIQGPRTRLNWPSHVAVHEERGEIFVANDADDSVLVFRLSDNGDVAPTRVIKGPRTGLMNPTGVAVDHENDEVWATSMGNYKVTAYPIDANGDLPPLRTIRGGPEGKVGQMIGNPGAVGYDTLRNQILVPN